MTQDYLRWRWQEYIAYYCSKCHELISQLTHLKWMTQRYEKRSIHIIVIHTIHTFEIQILVSKLFSFHVGINIQASVICIILVSTSGERWLPIDKELKHSAGVTIMIYGILTNNIQWENSKVCTFYLSGVYSTMNSVWFEDVAPQWFESQLTVDGFGNQIRSKEMFTTIINSIYELSISVLTAKHRWHHSNTEKQLWYEFG